MNASNAVGAAAGLALVAILGISVLQKPEQARTVTVEETVTSSSANPATPAATDAMGAVATTSAPSRTLPGATAATSATAPLSTTLTTTGGGSSSDTTAAVDASSARAATTQPGDSGGTTTPSSGATTTAAVDKASVHLGVVNASGKAGVATATATKLTKLGWGPKPESASWPSMGFSVVYYAPGQQQAAQAVAASLGLTQAVVLAGQGAAPWSSFSSSNYDVLVLAGKDLR